MSALYSTKFPGFRSGHASGNTEKKPVDPSIWEQMGYLGSYLKPHKKILIFSLILSALSTALGMLQPWFAKILIDRVFLGHQPGILFPVLGVLILLLVVGFGVRVANRYLYTKYSARILFAMREDLFSHLQRIPLVYFSKNKIGDIYSRIASDMADIQALVTDIFPKYLFDFLTFIITAVILFWLNWEMTLMSLAILPFAVWVVQAIKPKLFALSEDLAKTNAGIAHFLFESLSNTAAIRAFGAENCENEKLSTKQSGILDLLLRFQVLGAVSGSVPMAFAIVNTLIVFGFGGMKVLEGNLTIGTLVAFSVYQGRVFGPLQGLLDGILSIQKSKVALKRVREILDISPSTNQTGDQVLSLELSAKDLAIEDLSFSYDGQTPVFKNLSFTIPHGKTTALAGESGIGKTTLCHLFMRLYAPDAGTITWGGKDIHSLDRNWFRTQMAMVSQETFLFHTSILENIRFFKPDADIETVKKAAKAAQIHEFIESLPKGYDTLVGDRGTRLCGGQKQRLSIARAILMDPKILILDEATAFLDKTAEEGIKQTLKDLMKNKTIILVSHRKTAISHAHHLVVLGNEGLIFQGRPQEFTHDA
ncbi:ABC transporter ATP-binding protein [Desulfobacter hydrogenophilus]|uniref:ABC transporter ATP-binding protein n=1 Tax=Desulfobacter hydrogenophilus TaxID=2291 RepID=UPI0013EF8C44|nr:ABC transporter ATP-binding protein [Desulfobacter hydrogenophilus]